MLERLHFFLGLCGKRYPRQRPYRIDIMYIIRPVSIGTIIIFLSEVDLPSMDVLIVDTVVCDSDEV